MILGVNKLYYRYIKSHNRGVGEYKRYVGSFEAVRQYMVNVSKYVSGDYWCLGNYGRCCKYGC